jgi:hypothetical protein
VVVAVPVKLSQIRFLDEQQRLPPDISSALIFTQPALGMCARFGWICGVRWAPVFVC